MSVTVRFEGAEELRRQLDGLAREIQDDISRKASVDSVRGLASEIRAEAPGRTGQLKRSIIPRATRGTIRKTRQGLIFADVVATRSGNNKGGYYLHLVDKGHKLVKKTRLGLRKVLGFVPGTDFVDRGFKKGEKQVVDDFFESVRSRVAKFNRQG
jgi:hypothetical protein